MTLDIVGIKDCNGGIKMPPPCLILLAYSAFFLRVVSKNEMLFLRNAGNTMLSEYFCCNSSLIPWVLGSEVHLQLLIASRKSSWVCSSGASWKANLMICGSVS